MEKNEETLLKEINVNFDDIIFPIYRAIKNFLAYEIDENHWKEMENYKIQELTNLIKVY